MPTQNPITLGATFGRLTIVEAATTIKERSRWTCKCTCGNLKTFDSANLKSGHTQSCGCLQKDRLSAAVWKHGHTASYKRPREYRIWNGMKNRCSNPSNPVFKYYGGRGITVCDRWLDYSNFLADMGNSNGLSIDRINNDDGYKPENCRWASQKEQVRNTRLTSLVRWNGLDIPLASLAERMGISKQMLKNRLKKGMPLEQALIIPPQPGVSLVEQCRRMDATWP